MNPHQALNLAIIFDDVLVLPDAFDRRYKDTEHPLVVAMIKRKYVKQILTKPIRWDSSLFHEVVQCALEHNRLPSLRIIVPTIDILDDLLNGGSTYRYLFNLTENKDRARKIMKILAKAQKNPSVAAKACLNALPQITEQPPPQTLRRVPRSILWTLA